MGRAPNKEGLKKGAWTAEEDEKLVSFIRKNNGHGSWRTLPELAGLQRCGKSCRLRWTNYLRPNIKRGNFTLQEEWSITQLHSLLGNKWSTIASRLPGRTDNEVKNHWNTHLKKQLSRLGIDPATDRPASCVPLINVNNVNVKDDKMMKHSSSLNCNQKSAWPRVSMVDKSYVSHMAQWELARLEAEGRQMGGKASATTPSSTSSDCMRYPASSAGISQASTNSCSRGQGEENDQLLDVIFRELLEAPLPSLDTSHSSTSASSQLFMNEADITSDLTSLFNTMSPRPSRPLSSSSSSSSPACHLHLLIPPASPLPPCDATYWANMLSLVGPVISSCPS